MKVLPSYYLLAGVSLVGIVSSISFELFALGYPVFLDSIVTTPYLFVFGALFGLIGGLCFEGMRVIIGKREKTINSILDGFSIWGFVGAVVGGIVGYFALLISYILFVYVRWIYYLLRGPL